MSITDFHIVWTIVALLIFVGIVMWAWSTKRKKRFEEAARLPLEDERHESSSRQSGD